MGHARKGERAARRCRRRARKRRAHSEWGLPVEMGRLLVEPGATLHRLDRCSRWQEERRAREAGREGHDGGERESVT
eukprot:2500250-Pyramimonas_sp.AAC.1